MTSPVRTPPSHSCAVGAVGVGVGVEDAVERVVSFVRKLIAD